MNIHEHQAKEIIRKFGIKVPNGVVIFSLSEIDEKFQILKKEKIALKAQIHAGGRGKAGGIKIVKNINELKKHAKDLLGKKLVTHQTDKKGIEIIETFPLDRSLGIFYATMTSFLGFKPGEDEYKVMGLAPYGKPNIDLSFFCQPTESGNKIDLSFFRERKKMVYLSLN